MDDRVYCQPAMMSDVWTRLQRAMETRFPHAVLGALNPPATMGQIEAAERAMGVRLPDDVRAAYLRFNGVNHGARLAQTHPLAPSLIVPYFDWCDLDNMVSMWQMFREVARSCPMDPPNPDLIDPTDKVQYILFDPRRIPIGDAKMSTAAFIDMMPGGGGTMGQLIMIDLQDVNPIVMAVGFQAYFEKFVHLLEQGSVHHDPGTGHWCRSDNGEWVTDLDGFADPPVSDSAAT